MNCRIDKKKCEVFLDLGKMPISNKFLHPSKTKDEYFFSLKVGFNKRLSLVQLATNPKPKKMFNKNYPFYTSSSVKMTRHFKKFSDFIKKKFLKKKNYKLLEIGSNDGTFLKNFNKEKVYGFEPSKSVHLFAKKKGLKSINKFFNYKNTKDLKKKFDVVVGSNVFCHIPDQIDLIKSIDKVLNDNGTLIFEEPYLGSMYDKISYDQLYDEHIYMFSAIAIKKIYKKFNFILVDAIPQNTHGGSMRYVLKKKLIKSPKISKRLKSILKKERKKNIDKFSKCLKFRRNVLKSKIKLLKKLNNIKKEGHKICGYGATSKSTTILNFCKIDNKLLDCIFDTTKDKIGKLTPGSHIPIVDHKFFKDSKYKYVFLFAWNHKNEIYKKEKNRKFIKWISHL